MARYLTPAKICLLALIELYTDAEVPTSSTIPILSFLLSYILHPSLPSAFSSDTDLSYGLRYSALTTYHFEELLFDHSSASGQPGRTLWHLFLLKLWEIDSLDALHLFFDRRSWLLQKTREELQIDTEMGIPPPSPDMILLSRTSPFGIFVRQAQVEFSRLKFHDALNLWKNFVAYRQATYIAWKKRNPLAGHWSFDTALHDGTEEWDDHMLETLSTVAYGNLINQPEESDSPFSTDDVEKLLEFQIEQMQKLGNRIPEKLQDQFRVILDSNITMPSLSHYIRYDDQPNLVGVFTESTFSFLEAWKAGDYPTSFDSLHQFFDYTMQNKDRSFYQYALLNLAVLEADFGSYQEAVTAMQETVSVARENKDMSCLNFSLSWLYHFSKAHPKVVGAANKTNMLGVEREGLVFLRTKAKESEMWNLWSAAVLTEAKAGLSSGESIAVAFENILRSSDLNVTKNMLNNVGTQTMLQSSMWSRLGVMSIALSYCEVFLRCHAKTAPFDDVLKITCRIAYLLTENGQYDEGMKRIESLSTESLRTMKARQYWLILRGILRLKRDLHQNNLDGAEQLLEQLLQCRDADSELIFELNRLHVDAMMRAGNYQGALTKIETLAVEQEECGEDIYPRVRLLIMKALVFSKCGRPQRGFSVAVRAAAIAWRARLLSPLWQAMGVIANILTSLKEFEASSDILASVIPRALECQDCALNAQLYSFLADAHMGMAGQADRESLEWTENINQALDFLDRAFQAYSSIEDIKGRREIMAKKSMIMKLVGDMSLANDCAGLYLSLTQELVE